MASIKHTIPIFDGENFALWRHRIKMVLVAKGISDALDNPAEVPIDRKTNYEKNSLLALTDVTLTLSDKQLQKVLHCTTAFSAMEILSKEYASKSVTRRITLKKQFFSLHMADGSNANDHIHKLDNLLTELKDIDAMISSEDSAIALLLSLPESWQNLVTAVEVNAGDSS
jgi:hypothetical protein